jgi:predicted dithiol-disulfide oxidoreductase (DUF899 family)
MASSQKIVSEADWLKARKKLLVKEKKFLRLQDAMSAERRNLPWVSVTKPYRFEGPGGDVAMGDLFDGRGQLIVYHFMFTAKNDAGCPHCSIRADGFNGIYTHLKHRDVTMVAVSRAPYKKLAAYEKRMGWTFDPGNAEREGHSVFVKDTRGNIFHTYSCYSRGNEPLNIHYHYLDMVPKGRDEGGRGPFWVRRHDEYND